MIPSEKIIHQNIFVSDEERKKYFANLFYYLMNIDPIEYKFITDQINSTDYNNIFISSDLHFLRDDVFSDMKKIENHNKTIKNNSIWIYLGDLGYKRNDNTKLLKSYVTKMNKGKFSIMIIGNHDIYGKSFYKEECGFSYVCRGFVSNNIVFTHIPIKPDKLIKNNYNYNICGHLHDKYNIFEYAQLYPEFKEIIDKELIYKYKIIYNKNNDWRPFSLDYILNNKEVKIIPAHG